MENDEQKNKSNEKFRTFADLAFVKEGLNEFKSYQDKETKKYFIEDLEG